MEQILPILKSIFLNFDYYLIVIILLTWFFCKIRPNSALRQKIVKIGSVIYGWFNKLVRVKVFKLLLIFFILNLIIRLGMAIAVPEMSLNCGTIMDPHYINLANSLYAGEGFTTHVVWNNFLQPSQVIRPDFFRVPFYPVLITIFFYIFGHAHFSAQLVNVLAASLLPILAYLLAYILSKSKKIATLLLIFISFNILFLRWVAIISPEIILCCCVILLLYFLYKTKDKARAKMRSKSKGNFYALLVGLFWGLAYLTRTEGLHIFLPVILFYYFYKSNKKEFLIKTLLSVLVFLIIASPYLIRNYVLTKNPFYTDFPRINMITYTGHGDLIESPTVEYKNIYDMVIQNPWQSFKIMLRNISDGLTSIPTEMLQSYLITFFCLLGIYVAWKKNRQKYYFIFLAIPIGFLIPTIIVGFSVHYMMFIIVLFYFFACLGIFKLYNIYLKNNSVARSLLVIYLFIFIIWSGLLGIGLGTVPNIPHSFYQRFDAQRYYNGLAELFNYIKENTSAGDVIMVSRRPYEVYYFTQRPVVIFPFTDEQGVQEFMKKYQVKWIIRAGNPDVKGDKFKIFWPEAKYPENVKPEFENPGGEFYRVEYYIDTN